MPRRPLAAVHEVWLGPRLAIDGPRADNRNRDAPARRIPRARVHDMGVDFALRPEELFVTAGGGHRHVLEENLRRHPACIPRILDLDPPTPRLRRRSPHTIDTATRPRHESDAEAVLSQYIHHPVDGVSFADAAGVHFHARP